MLQENQRGKNSACFQGGNNKKNEHLRAVITIPTENTFVSLLKIVHQESHVCLESCILNGKLINKG